MIRRFDLPIRRRLTLLILTTCTVVLLAACTALGVYDAITFSRSLVRTTTATADMLATNAQAALSFRDEEALTTLLSALASEPTIASAVVRDDREIIAHYPRDADQTALPDTASDGHVFTMRSLVVTRPITLNGTRIGTIQLQSDLAEMHARFWVSIAVMVVVLILSLALAFLLSARLQRPISDPIMELARTAQLIAERRDYSVRAPPQGRHEIGALTDAFNHMLATLAERDEELQRSNQELEQFAYIAAHDLQEPVRMIASYLQLLERRIGVHFDDRSRRYYAYANGGAERLSEMIRSLLEYSRIGRDDDSCGSVDLVSVVGRACDNLRVEIEKAHAVVEHGDLPQVTAVDAQVLRLVQNLLSNALKFRGDVPPRIVITGSVDGEWGVISIADNGIGIDPNDGKRLFTLFHRLHRIGAYPGTGIGLASCKKIVERQGGRIWFDQNTGGGTVFYFTLPKASP